MHNISTECLFSFITNPPGGYPPEIRLKCTDIKKRNNRKNRFKIGWNHKNKVLGYFPNVFFGTRGNPWGFAPLKKITFIESRQL